VALTNQLRFREVIWKSSKVRLPPKGEPAATQRRGYPRGKPILAQRRGYSSLEVRLKFNPESEAEFNHQREAQNHISVIFSFTIEAI